MYCVKNVEFTLYLCITRKEKKESWPATAAVCVARGARVVQYKPSAHIINHRVFLCVNAIFIVRARLVSPFVLMRAAAARWPFGLIQCHFIIKFVISLPRVFCRSPLHKRLQAFLCRSEKARETVGLSRRISRCSLLGLISALSGAEASLARLRQCRCSIEDLLSLQ